MLVTHLDLIRKLAWQRANSHPGLEFDDLFSEACIIVLERQHKYNPERGSETSFIWKVVDNHLSQLLRQEAYRNTNAFPVPEVHYRDYVNSTEEEALINESWQEFISGLSPEAQAICSMVMEEQDLYLPTDKPKKCKSIIKNELRTRGWLWREIWGSFSELKQAVNAW